VVHRDLKPENVMLVQRPGLGEMVKVLDFGIARFHEPGDGDHRLTTGNAVMGTPQYMSPEQAAGLPADARADVYALGLVLYEMLTGEPTFTAATAALVMIKQVNAEAPDLGRQMPPGLRRLVARMLRKRPEDRPQTMAEVLVALEAPLGNPGPLSGGRGLTLAAGLAAAVALVIAGWGWTQMHPEPVARGPPPVAPVVPPPLPPSAPLPLEVPTPVRAPVSISVASVPSGALVKVNGVERGRTPLAVEGQPDEVAAVTLSRAGYRPQSFELHFDAGAVPPLKLVALPKAASPASPPIIKTWNDSE
jgi:serine/threonine-protein kinase